jgi:hypothetical protein
MKAQLVRDYAELERQVKQLSVKPDKHPLP